MKIVEFDELIYSDLSLDYLYKGGNKGNISDDPISKLMKCENAGGFRKRGSIKPLELKYVVLYSTNTNVEWPNIIDKVKQEVIYFGDNKVPGNDMFNTKKDGNLVLKEIFELLKVDERKKIPPFFIFSKDGKKGRNVRFDGLLVPETDGLKIIEENNIRNYRAKFKILNVKKISREWLDELDKKGIIYDSKKAPVQWKEWISDKDVDYKEICDGLKEKEIIEGGSKISLIERNKRNINARKLKLEQFRKIHGKVFCESCLLDDEDVLQVHHDSIHISEMNNQYKTKLSDLKVLCANCHVKVHKKQNKCR